MESGGKRVELANFGVEMPITTEAHAVLFEDNPSPRLSGSHLMNRGAADELRGLGLEVRSPCRGLLVRAPRCAAPAALEGAFAEYNPSRAGSACEEVAHVSGT